MQGFTEKAPTTIPAMLRYQTHVGKDSCITPRRVFPSTCLALVTRWVKARAAWRPWRRATKPRPTSSTRAIDRTGFYRGTADTKPTARMNVTFRLPNEDLEGVLKGPRRQLERPQRPSAWAVAGVDLQRHARRRVEALVSLMETFEKKNG